MFRRSVDSTNPNRILKTPKTQTLSVQICRGRRVQTGCAMCLVVKFFLNCVKMGLAWGRIKSYNVTLIIFHHIKLCKNTV